VVRGWEDVSAALDFAASRFSTGSVTGFVLIGEHVSDDLASIVELEDWHARVGEREDIEEFQLRVTSTLRREGGDWRLVHRHADPVPTPDPYGPVRRRTA
jgi:ketosteroid isomerase-like protein